MPTARGLLKVTEVDGHLYVIGGRDDASADQVAVERYDPQTDTWHTMAPLLTGRGNPGVAAAGRHIFVVGGASAGGPLRTTERYDVSADRWHLLEPLLPVGRASLSATFIPDEHRHDHDDRHDSDRHDSDRHDDRGRKGQLVAFGGFEIAGGPPPIAAARVEALTVHSG